MPVPKLGGQPVGRESTHIAPPHPDDGVVEIRVHGVGGTSAETLLADLAPDQVAGDRVAGFYRTADADGRHIEAYSWGGLTSRSGSRILWILLFPFMLANLAGWMVPAAVRQRPRWEAWHRGAARLAALAVTVNFFLVAALIIVDVVAFQCGGQERCVEGKWWFAPTTWFGADDHPGRRIVLGTVAVVLIALLLVRLSYRSRVSYESIPPPRRTGDRRSPPLRSAAAAPDGLRDGDFWAGVRSTTRFGRCHLAVVLAFLALMVLVSTRRAEELAGGDGWLGGFWLVLVVAAAGVIALSVASLITEAYDSDREAEASGTLRALRSRLTPGSAGFLVAAASVVLVAAALYGWSRPEIQIPLDEMSGMRWFTTWTYTAIFAALVPSLVVAVAFTRKGQPGTFPWGGPFVLLTLAVAGLNMMMQGALIGIAQLLGQEQFALSELGSGDGSETTIFLEPVFRVIAPYLTMIPILVILGWSVWQVLTLRRGRAEREAAVVSGYTGSPAALADPPPPPARPAEWYDATLEGTAPLAGAPAEGDWWDQRAARRRTSWQRKVARQRWLAGVPTEAGRALVLITLVAIPMVIIIEIDFWLDSSLLTPPEWLLDLGVLISVAAPFALMGLLRSGWGDVERRRQIGILWDVGTFWPRSFHPWAPPSYAERAVPELQRRLWWLHDSGARVLLVTHSQGTIVAAAALASPDARPPTGLQVAFVTFGSPLRKLYHWAFPAYFSNELLDGLADPEVTRGWRNFYYPTDPIGGPVLVTGADPAGTPVDRELLDPASPRHVYGQPQPAIGGHSGYWTDPRMWAEISELADELVADPSATEGVSRPLLDDPAPERAQE